jgi:hypothetical protein
MKATYNISNNIQVGMFTIVNLTTAKSFNQSSTTTITYALAEAFLTPPQVGVGIFQLEGTYKLI